MKLEDTIKAIYYCINYLKMKEISINENYFIFKMHKYCMSKTLKFPQLTPN